MPERDNESLGVMGWGIGVVWKFFRRRRRRRRPPWTYCLSFFDKIAVFSSIFFVGELFENAVH